MTFTSEQVEAVRRAYPDAWDDRESEGEDSWVVAEAALRDAPLLDRRFSWGAYDPIHVDVHGVLGAYYIRAIELDDIGVFSTLDEALNAATDFFECAGLFATEEELLAFAQSKGWI